MVQEAVDTGNIPGGVVLVGHNGKGDLPQGVRLALARTAKERMTVDTIFDLASLTKCVATATAVMQLVQNGKCDLNDPVADYLPEFGQQRQKDQITVRELLTHFTGLPGVSA